MRKKLLNFFAFIVMVLILLAVLKVANWLPTAIEQGMLRKYASLEDVRSKLNIRDILVPSYFPQDVSWPPSEILAQTKPFIAVAMEFKHRESGDTAIVISQAASSGFNANDKIRLVRTSEKVTYPLKGRNAALIVGACRNETPCSMISWDEGKYRISIAMKAPPFDLTKIAESMVR